MFYGVINESYDKCDYLEMELENFNTFCKSLSIVQESGIQILQESAWETFKEKVKELWDKFKNWVKDIIAKIKSIFTKDSVKKAEEANKSVQNAKGSNGFEPFEIEYQDATGEKFDPKCVNAIDDKVLSIIHGDKDFNKSIDELRKFEKEGFDNFMDFCFQDLYKRKKITIKSVDEAKRFSDKITNLVKDIDNSITDYNKAVSLCQSSIFQFEKELNTVLRERKFNGKEIESDTDFSDFSGVMNCIINIKKTALMNLRIKLSSCKSDSEENNSAIKKIEKHIK